jgi:IPT/TIG domain
VRYYCPQPAMVGSRHPRAALTGTGFVSSSVVQWNGAPLPTTYVSPWQISALVSATDIASLPVVVTVKNPAGTSPPFELR